VRPIELSVVVPAFEEAQRLPSTLASVLAHIEARPNPCELIVVDDGSSDATAAVAEQSLAPLGARGRVIRFEENRGKGAAVRSGVEAAEGERILITDADLSTPLEELAALERACDAGADIAIGSRALDRSLVLRRQSAFREWGGRVFNSVAQLLVLPGIWDSQCGFKLFQGDVARDVFARARSDGFGFDVEVLAVARHLGYRIVEVPVRWSNDDDSRLSLGRGFAAFADPLRVRWGLWMGHYGARAGRGQP
jgi:dolichyl-phosphate beta-glucosyltransferase